MTQKELESQARSLFKRLHALNKAIDDFNDVMFNERIDLDDPYLAGVMRAVSDMVGSNSNLHQHMTERYRDLI